MIKRTISVILSLLFALSALTSCSSLAMKQLEEENAVIEEVPTDTSAETQPEIQEETASKPDPEPEPERISADKTSTAYTLSFAGDCTLGGIFEYRYSEGSFDDYVSESYEYPFEYCQPYFKNDDFTLVNLECVLSESRAAVTKRWRLIGEPDYAKILTAGNIEAVNLANNHTYDFGVGGFEDTKAALESENIKYAADEETLLYTTDTGLVIGVYSAQFSANDTRMKEGIQQLREDGAEIIIFSYHGGIELSYRSAYSQEYYCRGAIDAGADIVFGHHPHVLQPVEEYNGGVIYYSLGNFSFGGNGNPQDKDSAIIQQKVIRDAQGNVSLGETILIPFSVTSTPGTNDYRPIPFEVGTEGYDRCIAKLTGTYTGPDLQPLNFGDSEDEEEEEPEENNGENTQPPEGGAEETPPEIGEEGGGVEPEPDVGGEEIPPEDSGGEEVITPEEPTAPETENTEG